MKFAQTLSLWLIAGLLGAGFLVDHVVPSLSLAMHRKAYLAASEACHEARSYSQQVAALSEQLESHIRTSLQRTAAVSMLDCQTYHFVRNGLLAAGVKEKSLRALDESSLRASSASLSYAVQTAGE